MIFDDEFSGTQLDTNTWQPGWFGTGIVKPVNTNVHDCDNSALVTISGGALHLAVKKKKIVCGGKTQPYESGMVSSNPTALGAGKGFAFQYGVVEFRAKVPSDPTGHCADWASLWMDGQHWPDTGEIDVFECLAGQSMWNLHSGKLGGASGVPGEAPANPTNWTGWHTYAVDWQPGRATIYYDGQVVGSHTYVVPHPNYLVISDDVRSGSAITSPSSFEVDWVRVWQHSKASDAKPLTLAPAPAGA